MIKFTEIEQRAQAAKQWTAYMRAQGRSAPDWPDATGWAELGIEADDSAHIAGMSPDVVLQMVAALRAAKLAMTGANKLHWDALRAALSEIEE